MVGTRKNHEGFTAITTDVQDPNVAIAESTFEFSDGDKTYSLYNQIKSKNIGPQTCPANAHFDANLQKCVCDDGFTVDITSPDVMKCIPVITAGGGGGGGVGIQDGTIVIGTPINNGVSYFFDATKDPKSDPRLDLHEALEKPPQLLTEGSTKFVRFTSHVGGLHSNGTQLTCRVHIKTMSSGNVQCYWDTCTPSKGFMVGDKDLGDGEVTAIVRPNGIVDHGEAVTMKRRGGNHSNGHFASCIGFIFNYNCNAKMFEKEFDHPHYEFYNINIIKPYPSYEDKWVGLKALSLVLPDKTCRNVGYVNPDPLDSNGKPKNDGWFKVFEYIDKGKGKKYAPVCTWGGSLETVRCDQAKTMDIAYLNYVAISAIP